MGGQACTNGSCGCGPGQTTCNGACTDVQTSAAHCGMCNNACPMGQTCTNGTCGSMQGTAGAGQGGSGGGAPTAGSGGGGGAPPVSACAKAGMIANFEEGTGKAVVIPHEGRSGEFESFDDGTSTQTMAVEPSGGTAECDKSALHVSGKGFTMWGAGVGFNLAGTGKAPMVYNATMNGFTGVRFKAKLGATADSKSPVRFNISTPFTESKDNTGGQCDPATLAATTTKAKMDCYQHPGKFLHPGTGAGALTQSWQTFTYCFDRDLYPLSLPSNMTTEQRNNVGASILKMQFQFNQGKDYSGAYTSMYPAFAKTLPFDFWLDDIEFFKGDCPNMVTSPSNGSPAKPFPQNENVGSCAPATNAAKFNDQIAKAYATWQKNFVMNDHVVAPEQQGAITSEALGYGMMIAAAMGDKALFDKFHGYVKANGGTGNGLMTWKNGGSGSASDGDGDITYALYMAHKQWPTGGYKAAADAMAAAMLSQDIVNNIVRGGSQFRDAPFNPSYFAPGAYRAFVANGVTGFSSVITANYTLVNANVGAATAGVPTDWANPSSGAPSGPGSAQVTSEIIDGDNGAMGYDAARVPWRLALDACLGATDKTALNQMVNYFAAKYNMGASIDLMKAGWYKRMDAAHPMARDSQGSYIGPIGTGAMAVGNTVMRDRAFRAILDILESGDFNRTYFPSTLGMLTLLFMSGNFPTP